MAVTPRWHTREDSGLSLDANVDWFHDGARIEHPNIIEAFNRGLRVDDDGRLRLEFGGDWCFVTAQRAAFRVVAVDASPDDRLSLRLSDRTAEWLDADSLCLDGEVIEVKVKGGRAWARFSRQAQLQLAEHLEVDGSALVLRVGQRRWPTSLPFHP